MGFFKLESVVHIWVQVKVESVFDYNLQSTNSLWMQAETFVYVQLVYEVARKRF